MKPISALLFIGLVAFSLSSTVSAETARNFLSFAGIDEPQACGVCCSVLPQRPPMNFTYFIDTAHFVGGSGIYAIDTYGYSGNGKRI